MIGVNNTVSRVSEFMTIPGQDLPAVFTDRENMFLSGEDIQLMHYRQVRETNKAFFTLHTNILSFVLHGNKQVYHSRGKLAVGTGEGFFLRKGNYLGTERSPEPGRGYESVIILVSDHFLEGFAGMGDFAGMASPAGKTGKKGMEENSSVFHFRQDELLTALTAQLAHYFETMQEKARIEALLPLKMRELLSLLISAPANAGFGSLVDALASERPDKLEILMEAHFRESLHLDQWAFLAGLSLSSFKRRFDAVFGMPPRKWIQLRRLQEAHQLLGNERMNVTEVCYAVGFENPAHFSQAFKQQFGISPKQWQVEGKG